jgi:DtxR family Mn-dependent transcriptional regulator
MPSSTIEDYLKQIYLHQPGSTSGLLSMGNLSEAMDVAPGTATAMVKRLAEATLVRYEPYAGVRLTARGQRLAINVLRRHRLIESFLVEVLGLDWSEVHEEAEHLEHVISDRLLERIDAVLGHPVVDPHGDPIPGPDGRIANDSSLTLVDVAPGTSVTVERVLAQDEAFLSYADANGLRPGRHVTVLSKDAVAKSVTVQAEDAKPVSLSIDVASLWVVTAKP